MIAERKNKEKITVSFSGSVGSDGLRNIKNYIEFLEKARPVPRKKVFQLVINKFTDDVTASA